MAVLGIQTNKDACARSFFEESHNRLQKEDIVKNPFRGFIKRIGIKSDKMDYHLVIMDPIYPPVPLLGILFMFIPLIFTGFRLTVWQIPGGVFFLLLVFWSKYFYYIMLKLGLRKQGYNGKTWLIRNARLIREISQII